MIIKCMINENVITLNVLWHKQPQTTLPCVTWLSIIHFFAENLRKIAIKLLSNEKWNRRTFLHHFFHFKFHIISKRIIKIMNQLYIYIFQEWRNVENLLRFGEIVGQTVKKSNDFWKAICVRHHRKHFKYRMGEWSIS